jgi:hypothetical protein
VLVLLVLPIADSTWALSLPALVLSIAWLFSESVRRTTSPRYLLGHDLPEADETSESGIGITTGILTAGVTLIGALMLDEKSKDYLLPESSGLAFYEVGNLLLLGMLSGVLRSTKTNAKGTVRSYDMGTRKFVYWAMVWIIGGGMIAVPALGYYGKFPTHNKKITLPIQNPAVYDFKDPPYTGQNGLSFQVVIQPSDFNDEAIPENLFLKVAATDKFNRDWIVTNDATDEILSGSGSWQEVPEPPAGSEQPTVGPETAIIRTDKYASGASREIKFFESHLLPTQSTRVMFRLAPRSSKGITAAARDAALKVLKTEHPITVTANIPPRPAAK